MKKLIITAVFTIAVALTGMTAWAATIGNSTLNDFSSGSTLSSTDMNDNFTVIKDAVNANSSSRATLPDGVPTSLSYYFAAPADYVPGSIIVSPYWSGCEGADVRLGFSSQGYILGNNGFIAVAIAMSTFSVPSSGASTYRIAASTHLISDISSNVITNFTISREGADALDTCTSDLRLWGIKLLYPTSSLPKTLFIPAHALSR